MNYPKNTSKEIFFATLPNCGKVLRVLTTTLIKKLLRGTRLIAEPNGNNVKNWIIRSQVPNSAMQGYGKGSTTKC